MVSTHLKNISQIGSFPHIEVKIKHIWNHHPVFEWIALALRISDWTRPKRRGVSLTLFSALGIFGSPNQFWDPLSLREAFLFEVVFFPKSTPCTPPESTPNKTNIWIFYSVIPLAQVRNFWKKGLNKNPVLVQLVPMVYPRVLWLLTVTSGSGQGDKPRLLVEEKYLLNSMDSPSGQWLFLVPIKGGRDYITSQKATYKWYKKWYILLIGWLYTTYHPLQEAEKSIDLVNDHIAIAGISPCSIGNTSSNGPFPIAMLVYRFKHHPLEKDDTPVKFGNIPSLKLTILHLRMDEVGIRSFRPGLFSRAFLSSWSPVTFHGRVVKLWAVYPFNNA